ncbi:MAG: SCP2 sterol-binding domain-containing protein [Bacteroidota bacterium]
MNLEEIITEVQQKASTIDPLGYVVKFVFEDESSFFLDGKGDANTVAKEGTDPDTTIKVKQKSFLNLIRGKLDPTIAFMSGRIKVDGKLGVALKLQDLFKA